MGLSIKLLLFEYEMRFQIDAVACATAGAQRRTRNGK
jgi:hypothetical protein